MKSDSKYYPLYQRLTSCQQESVTLTLAEIEADMPEKLPGTARVKRSWWSNRSKGALQAKAWLEAGYQTEQVDLKQETIRFKKYEAEYRVAPADHALAWDGGSIRALRKHMQLTQAEFADTLGVRRQTVSEWENGVYQPDRSTSKHLELVAEKEAFAVETVETTQKDTTPG